MDVLLVVDSWIVGGDLNNLESPSDYRAYTPPHLSEIATAEIDEWDSFLFALSLSDAWHEHLFTHTEGTLQFSWGFRRQAGRLLERLDRFYIGAWAAGIGGSMTIWPGTALSDHAPVSIRILGQRPDAPRRGCRIPDVILSPDTLQAELQDMEYYYSVASLRLCLLYHRVSCSIERDLSTPCDCEEEIFTR